MVKNPPANGGDTENPGSILSLEDPLEGGNGNQLQYSCLRNPMGIGSWRVMVHGVAKSQIGLNDSLSLSLSHTHTHLFMVVSYGLFNFLVTVLMPLLSYLILLIWSLCFS